MSPIAAYHATPARHREGIAKHGLLCGQPTKGRPFGVYVYRDDDSFDHPMLNNWIFWGCGGKLDKWSVSYIGPMIPDKYVSNGMILLAPVPRENLTLT